MDENKQYNWFLIMVSWDWDADGAAVEKFQWVYDYLNVTKVKDSKSGKEYQRNPDDPRHALDFSELQGFNLIGQRKFVIIVRTNSNNVLQEISSNVTLGTAIRVDIFPATYVHQFGKINLERLGKLDKKNIEFLEKWVDPKVKKNS